jgi:hypothetical protein
MREDPASDHFKPLEDTHYYMEDFLIEALTKACPEIGERCFTGEIFHAEAGIGSVGSSPVLISQQGKDIVAIETAFEVAKEVDQKDAGRIIAGWAEMGITVSDQAANEGEIDQGGDHFGIATLDGTVGENLDKSFVESVG